MPSTVMAAMVSGMAMASIRQVDPHFGQDAGRRSSSGRSRASPTPISATMTASSVTCSMSARFAVGSTGMPSGSGVMPIANPTAVSTIGAETAQRSSRAGSTTASSRLMPATR